MPSVGGPVTLWQEWTDNAGLHSVAMVLHLVEPGQDDSEIHPKIRRVQNNI